MGRVFVYAGGGGGPTWLVASFSACFPRFCLRLFRGFVFFICRSVPPFRWWGGILNASELRLDVGPFRETLPGGADLS